MDRSKSIFGNEISNKVYDKALKSKKKQIKKFGDDSNAVYHLSVEENSTLAPFLGIKNIVTGKGNETIDAVNGIIIGNIRMGFGHYRISMAIASAAHSMGYTPYWFDLHSYNETTGGKVIAHLNSLYSMGSRWSQKYPLFNKFYWEPLNSEGFKKLSYNAMDQKVSELMTPIYKELPKDMPFIATHVWPAQAAVHAGLTKIVNVIPDNWPMALHLAEGSIHVVQTPSSFLGYKTLKGMDGKKILNSMPDGDIYDVGHYIDHELVVNLDSDCEKRLQRIKNKKAKRILLTVGGAGAQKEIFAQIIRKIIPLVKNNEAVLYINVGDHKGVWEDLCEDITELSSISEKYFDNWDKTCAFSEQALENDVSGIHAFYNEDIFAAVYSSNLLMRSCDLIITKPSELAFYPVPKLLIKRVGGHEAWGAVRAAEVGDGTIECDTVDRTLQMLHLMLSSDEILTMLCNNIIKANKIGIYNGAYMAVELAVKGRLVK
jgi:UDP-N-acetylglucosamine:LPS N-acetylglucosamine transferase